MAGPPSYANLAPIPIPSYTAEPQLDEYRLAVHHRRIRPSGDFVKHSKNGGFSLRLIGQEEDASQPVYGNGGSVEGTVNVSKPEGVLSVEVKVGSNMFEQ